jgi:methylmalonyl-CoA/ethylmalonyl-CoA epimerase
MIIDHIGIVVKSIENGIELWKNVFGYKQTTEVVINTRQKVKVVFLRKEKSTDIKLIEPTDETSPVYALKQKGGGIHHLCFRCSSLNNELIRLKNSGMRIITQPQPGEAFEDENIAFLFTKGLNIELIDTDKRARLIHEE